MWQGYVVLSSLSFRRVVVACQLSGAHMVYWQRMKMTLKPCLWNIYEGVFWFFVVVYQQKRMTLEVFWTCWCRHCCLVSVLISVCVYVCVCMSLKCVCVCMCMYICVCVCVCVHVCVCVWLCVCVNLAAADMAWWVMVLFSDRFVFIISALCVAFLIHVTYGSV